MSDLSHLTYWSTIPPIYCTFQDFILSIAEQSFFCYMFFISWFIDESLDWFLVLARVTWAKHGSTDSTVFFECIFRNGISWSKVRCTFSFLKTLYTILHNGYPSLHFHQQRVRVLFSPQLHQYYGFFFFFLAIVIITGMRHSSLMASDTAFVTCLLPIYISSFGKLSIQTLCLLPTSSFILLLNFFSSLHILNINNLSDA